MCNLYAVRKSAAEVAGHFGADISKPFTMQDETTPRAPGMVVRLHGDRRLLQQPTWGFPRLTAEMRAKGQNPTPVNLTADLTSPMWSDTVRDPRYRCLIPVSEFAEAEGRLNSKTRTWFRVKEEPLFAWAGFCRNTPAWGPVYSGMTTDSNEAVWALNPRMPVLLYPDEWDRWLTGPIQDVIEFQFRKYPAERLESFPTTERWVTRLPQVQSDENTLFG
jgi:putative SOS response-associated peptidase YedK